MVVADLELRTRAVSLIEQVSSNCEKTKRCYCQCCKSHYQQSQLLCSVSASRDQLHPLRAAMNSFERALVSAKLNRHLGVPTPVEGAVAAMRAVAAKLVDLLES